MDKLGTYGSDDEDDAGSGASTSGSASTMSTAVVLAPGLSHDPAAARAVFLDPSAKTVDTNLSYDAMYAPVLGPDNPFRKRQNKNVLTGFVEADATDQYTFEAQRKSFMTLGYALDPSSNAAGERRYVGDAAKAAELDGATVFDRLPARESTRKRKDRGDAYEDPLNYQGPWAGFQGERMHLTIDKPAESSDAPAEGAAPTEEGEETAGGGAPVGGDDEEEVSGPHFGPGTERSTFHGKAEKDYLGRPWTTVPMDVDVNLLGTSGQQSCFLPKKLVHTWTGHTKGINAIRWFPKSAHLLLSAGMDNKIKIWQVYHERALMRTYLGHSKSVRDICFSNDGTQFLSASYDRNIKLWDTETGRCISVFSNRKIPYCVKFNPDNDKQHSFIAGFNDKRIIQWDTRQKKITQEYDQHLGAVNTVTFVDNNRRFVSTSDDKTIRVWDWGVPVVIKYVADPSMHSVPSATIHPSGQWWLGQSLDNQIVVYSALSNFKMHRSKNFKGHNTAGYACQIGCSPDGRFISSSDGEGNVYFWDWNSCKVLKKMRCHNQVAIGCEWHPHESSKMATASWDGTIKFWD